MKRLLIYGTLAALTASAADNAHGAINSPDARGYFERGVAMYNDKNYNGCLDQLLQLRNLDPSEADCEEALYYIAMSTLHSGDDEAIDFLNRFLDSYPQSVLTADVTTAVGDYYFTRGTYGEAIKSYLTVNPECLTDDRAEDLRYRTAYSYMMLGENAEALPLFRMLEGSKTYGNAARLYQAYIAYSKGDYTSARRLFSQVDQNREPGRAARYYLCQLDFLDGDFDKASREAEQMLKEGADAEFRPELERIAGESLFNLGRNDSAIPYLRRYVSSGQNVRPSAYYMLGVSEYENGNYNEAIPMLQMAVGENDITGQSAYLFLGQSYMRTGQTDAAMLAFDKASRMTFDSKIAETAAYNYIAARMDGGRVPFANSVGMLENFIKKYPKSNFATNVRESLVTGYMTDSDYDNALRVLEEISRPSDKMIRAKQSTLLMLGTRAYQAGDPEKALDYLDDGAAITKGNAEVSRQCRLWAANCNYDLENYDEAATGYLDFLSAAPASDTNRLQAYYNLGYTRLKQQRYDEAFKDFMKVADNSATDNATRADALTRAADCLYCQRRFNEAGEYYDKAYRMYPQSGDYALFQQAEMNGFRRDYNTRLKLLEEMLSKYPSSALAPEAMMAKAETFTVTGRRADALSVYNDVIEGYPSTAQARRASLMVAMNRMNGGDRAGAIEAYRKVVETYPSSQEARVALDDLKNIYAEDGQLPEYVMFVNSVAGAPEVEISDFEATAFANAEERFLTDHNADRLRAYVSQFTSGANLPKALLYLAEDAAEAGNADDALAYATRIVSNYPDTDEAEEAMLIKADSELAQGKGEIAFTSYRNLAARASSPDMLGKARMGVMQTGIDLNRYDDVIEATGQLLASSATNADRDQVEFCRALALERLNRHEEAYELWSRLAKDPSKLSGSKSAVYMIESLIENGDIARAEKMANEFIDAGSPHNYWYARGFIAYSDILRKGGKQFEADEYLRALRSNYPGDEADIFRMIDSRLEK